MYVLCKNCGAKIAVAGKPDGSTRISGVRVKGNVNVSGGKISFGPGGNISFGPGGSVGFGSPVSSEFVCLECGHVDEYHPDDFVE